MISKRLTMRPSREAERERERERERLFKRETEHLCLRQPEDEL